MANNKQDTEINVNVVLKKDRKNIIIELNKLIDLVVESFDWILKSAPERDAKFLVKVFSNEKKVKVEVDEVNERLLNSFLHSPFGKDLRRSISYVHIVKALLRIQNAASNISVFLNDAYEKNINQKWIEQLSSKIISLLKKVKRLIQNENVELAYEIYKADKIINDLYRDFLIQLEENNSKSKIKITEEHLKIGFILAVKNFEHAGDEIKEIAEMVKFISTGKYIS